MNLSFKEGIATAIVFCSLGRSIFGAFFGSELGQNEKNLIKDSFIIVPQCRVIVNSASDPNSSTVFKDNENFVFFNKDNYESELNYMVESRFSLSLKSLTTVSPLTVNCKESEEIRINKNKIINKACFDLMPKTEREYFCFATGFLTGNLVGFKLGNYLVYEYLHQQDKVTHPVAKLSEWGTLIKFLIEYPVNPNYYPPNG